MATIATIATMTTMVQPTSEVLFMKNAFFDPNSRYNRFRLAYRQLEKIQGFFLMRSYEHEHRQVDDSVQVALGERKKWAETIHDTLTDRLYADTEEKEWIFSLDENVLKPAYAQCHLSIVRGKPGERNILRFRAHGLKEFAGSFCRALVATARALDAIQDRIKDESIGNPSNHKNTIEILLRSSLLADNDKWSCTIAGLADIDAFITNDGKVECDFELPSECDVEGDDTRIVLVIDKESDDDDNI